MKKKIISLALALMMIAACISLASCGDTAEESTTTASTETTEAAETERTYPGEIINYNNQEFTIYMRQATFYDSLYIIAEDDLGDTMSGETFKRNSMLQKDLGITLKYKTAESPQNTLEAELRSGSRDYDLILAQGSALSSKATSGLLYDWNKMGIDFSNEWWDSNCANDLSISGKLYLMANDISVSRFSTAYMIYFNKNIVSKYGLTSPYDYVSKNEWTIDNFLSLIKSVSDVKTDTLGTYGIEYATGAANGAHIHLLGGAGVAQTVLNSDGTRSENISANIDKIDTLFSKIQSTLSDSNYCMDISTAYKTLQLNSDKNKNSRALFADGHFLFLQGGMIISQELVDMEDDYGVVPNPKFDTDQERYYHKIDKFNVIFALPNDSATMDMEMIANVVDYWAYLSTETVIPGYYDVTIKARRTSDPTAWAMCDIVRANVLFDFGDIFGTGISTVLNDGYTAGTIVSSWKGSASAIGKTIKKITDAVNALE